MGMQQHKLKSSFLARCFLRTLAFQNQWPGFYMSSALDRKMLLTCANIISSRDIGENIIYSDTYCFQSYPETKWRTYCHMKNKLPFECYNICAIGKTLSFDPTETNCHKLVTMKTIWLPGQISFHRNVSNKGWWKFKPACSIFNLPEELFLVW